LGVKLRLKRTGTTNRPCWRIVVADERSPRDGRHIEEIGFYDPKQDPAGLSIKTERAQYWLSVGAQPTVQVKSLLKKAKVC